MKVKEYRQMMAYLTKPRSMDQEPRNNFNVGGGADVTPQRIDDNFWIDHYRKVIDARLGAMEAVKKRGDPTNPVDAKYLFEQYNELKKYGGDVLEFDQRIRNLSPSAKEPEFAAQGGRIGQLVRNTVDGSRPGYKPGGIVEPGVEYYGKLIDESPSSKNTGNTSPVKKGKFIYPRKNRWGTVYSDTPHGGAEGWEKIRTPRDQGIQIKLLEATNKSEKFNAAKFAKDNDISMKELKKKAKLLQGSIYDKRMLASGKDMGRLKLKWIPQDVNISDNALSKLHASGLIVNKRSKIENLFYDAFGREYNEGTKIKNPTWNKKKHIAIKNNLTEYYQLKKAINAKYPSINFELDHPLSRSTLNKIFNASAEDLTRVNVLDAHLNNSFKDSLSRKYEKALGYGYGKTEKVGKVNLEAKKAIEKVARDLKINIGKVSTDLKDFKYGVKEFQKLNIRDEIIKSLKNQKDLNLNFKGYIKNNPELLKIAGFNDPSKIGPKLTKVTDKHIAGVTKIIRDAGIPCIKGVGGNCTTPEDFRKGFNQLVKEGAGGDKLAVSKMAKFTKGMRGLKGAATWTGYGLLAEAGFMVPFAVGDYAAGESWKRIIGNATDYGFGPILGQSEQEQFEAALPEGSKAVEGEKAIELSEQLHKLDEQEFRPQGRIGMDQARKEKSRENVITGITDEFKLNLDPFLSDTPFAKDQWHQGMWNQAHQDAADARAQIAKENLERLQKRRDTGTIAQEDWMVGGDTRGYATGGLAGLMKKYYD